MSRLTGFFFKIIFDDTIFKGMKIDHNQPSVGFEAFCRPFQSVFQLVQFMINGDPQSLKGACCRVNGIWCRPNNGINELSQFFGCFALKPEPAGK